jgi:hypothetical protein
MVPKPQGRIMPLRPGDQILYQNPSTPLECLNTAPDAEIFGFGWVKQSQCREIVLENNKQAVNFLLKK